MPKLTVLVGPSGAGKSTLANDLIYNDGDHGLATIRISQDDDGKNHLSLFQLALQLKKDIIVDRMNFDVRQRQRYLNPAKEAGYQTEIIVLHENYETCFKRCIDRLNHHPTIKTEENARSALQTFFTKYERPLESEANKVTFVYPETLNLNAIICDIDNTLSDADHREHHLQGPGRKDWKSFFEAMDKDPINNWCKRLVNKMRMDHIVILSSGRPDNYRNITKTWLETNFVTYDHLFMRPRNDSRSDTIVKEIILDFEIKTRVKNILFAIDDRKCVIDMLRSRGVVVLDCKGNTF